ncbi:MAG: sulfatase [Candidatus Nanopelagicales bacterium]|nr:sulfatase [Candidatus Nanopelagicales bacterium]
MPVPVSRRWSTAIAAILTSVAIAAVMVLGQIASNSSRSGNSDPSVVNSAQSFRTTGSLADIKNVVLLLADDLDWSTFDEVPRLAALKEQGTTLTNFVVTNSLCCPSRASLLRSQYVHNHQVVSNVPQTGGGWQTFYNRGLEHDCLPTWLQEAGVNTSLFGKYMNGFPGPSVARNYIPPGWNSFVTSISKNQSYKGYDYTLNRNGELEDYGHSPEDFLNDVLTQAAVEHLESVTSPFFMEFASYQPHTPAPVADRHIGSHLGEGVPRTPSFNVHGSSEVDWLAAQPDNTATRVAMFDDRWRKGLESTESIADTYDALVSALQRAGHLDDTLIVVTSDNGYHAGTHRLGTGKNTAYREDSVVPAVLIGPGIAQGTIISKITSMVDLGPTISSLLGAETPSWVDGRSLLTLISHQSKTPWRTAALNERLRQTKPGDPDYEPYQAPAFHASRSEQWLFVQYDDGEEELFDLINDPYEMDNIIATTDPEIVRQLRQQLNALSECSGESCRVADAMRNYPMNPLP